MEACAICQHPKHDEIMAQLARGRAIGLVAHYFRREGIEKMALVRHCQHEPIPRMMPPADQPDAGLSTNQVMTPGDTDGPSERLAQSITRGRTHLLTYPEYEVSTRPETAMEVLRQGLPYVRRAVVLAKDDRPTQEQIVRVLNQALADAEYMGL